MIFYLVMKRKIIENTKNYKETIKAIEKVCVNKIFENLKLGILDINPIKGYIEAYTYVQYYAYYEDANCKYIDKYLLNCPLYDICKNYDFKYNCCYKNENDNLLIWNVEDIKIE